MSEKSSSPLEGSPAPSSPGNTSPLGSNESTPKASQLARPGSPKLSTSFSDLSLDAAGADVRPSTPPPKSPQTPTGPSTPGPFNNFILTTPPKDTTVEKTPRSHQRWRHDPMEFGPPLHGPSIASPPPAPSIASPPPAPTRSEFLESGSPLPGRERRIRFAEAKKPTEADEEDSEKDQGDEEDNDMDLGEDAVNEKN